MLTPRIREYGLEYGGRWWTPSPLLEGWAAEGKGFAQAV